jgi:hypothetical protein
MTTEVALADQAIQAYGGLSVWNSAREILVELSSGGLGFTTKLQRRALRGMEGRVSMTGQRTVLSPYPAPGQRGVFENGAV